MQCMAKTSPTEPARKAWAKTSQTAIRMTEAEREAWDEAARIDGRSLSAWIIRRCNGEPATAPVLKAAAGSVSPTAQAIAAKPRRRQ
jgi:uncharacterized protein (DUF1778 family)